MALGNKPEFTFNPPPPHPDSFVKSNIAEPPTQNLNQPLEPDPHESSAQHRDRLFREAIGRRPSLRRKDRHGHHISSAQHRDQLFKQGRR